MNKKVVALLFLMGSFLGFLIDTAFRSITEQQLSHQGFFSNLFGVTVPFLPIYGIGLVIVYLLQPFAKKQHPVKRMLIYGLALTALEFVGGIFVEATLKIRLWDYSENLLNLFGHIDFFHTVSWILLGLVIYHFFTRYPPEKWLKKISHQKSNTPSKFKKKSY